METSVNNKCRAFTSLEQSKKLATILPIESADMHYGSYSSSFVDYPIPNSEDDYKCGYTGLPCWSLAALLSVLDFPSLTQNKEDEWEVCVPNHQSDGYIELSASNPVDACVAMIEKLNELKLL